MLSPILRRRLPTLQVLPATANHVVAITKGEAEKVSLAPEFKDKLERGHEAVTQCKHLSGRDHHIQIVLFTFCDT